MKKLLLFVGICLLNFVGYSQYSIDFGKSDNGIKVIENNHEKMTLTLNFSGVNALNVNTKEGSFSQLVLEGCYRTGNVGKPELPSAKKLIQVPYSASLSVEVVSFESVDYDLNEFDIDHKLLPYQPSYPKNLDPVHQKFFYNKEEYSKDAFNELEMAQIEHLGSLRGFDLAQLTINPVRYNPAKNLIRVYNNIEVSVTFTNGNKAKTEERKAKTASPYFEAINKLIINGVNTSKDAFDDNPDHTKYPVKYLIVTDPAFESQLADFVAWKTEKGFEVIMVTTDDIGATSAEIKSWIHGQYNAGTESDPAPTFFLLVGDTGQIPASQVGDDSNKATDLYYACVDGEDDIFPDMYYGRFSAQTSDQLQNMLDKVLYYEQYNFADDSYLNEVTLIAGADGTWNPVVGQPTINYGTENYFNAANGFSTVNTYLNSYSGCYDNERMRVGLINYTAHCNETSWQDPALSQSAVNSIDNINKYPLAIGNCCLAADFGYNECIGETWMRKANGGSVAYIGSSPSSYWYEDYYWSVGAHPYSPGNHPTFEGSTIGAYDAPYHSDYLCVDALIFVGNLAVTEAHNQGYDNSISTKYYWEAYNCLSDPSLFIYLTSGSDNSVSHLPTIPIGVTQYEVSAEPGSYVAISKDGVLHGAALVPESGTVVVDIEPIVSGGDAKIVVTKSQYKPYVTTIPAAALNGPYLTVETFEVVDASANGTVELGESFNIDLTIKNVGSETAEGVSASITTNDPYISSITNNLDVAYPNIASDNSEEITGQFSVVVSDSVPDQHIVSFTITMVDNSADKKTYEATKTVTLNAPKLELAAEMVLNDAATNGNGLLDPGEIATLTVSIANTGHAQVSTTAYLNFVTKNPFLTILEDEDVLGDIAAGESKVAEFSVEADASTPQGTPVNVEVTAIGGETPLYFDDNTYEVIIGQVPEVTIGEGSEVAQNYPFNNYYENNRSQILYLGSEIGPGSKVITDIAFDIAVATAASEDLDLANYTIKIIHTDLTQLSGFVDMSEATTVFEGSPFVLSGNVGWETFDFDTPYPYDGSSNLIIEVNWGDNGEYAASADRTKVNCTSTDNATVAYGAADSETPANFDGTSNIRPNLKMHVGQAHTLIFEVLNPADEPIEGATVNLGGDVKTTDDLGQVRYVFASQQYGLAYTINAHGYYEMAGTVDLDSEAVTESLNLVLKPVYDITFSVTSAGEPVAAAEISFNDESKETNASGLVTFNDVIEDTSYIYSVYKVNYVSVIDTIDADATKTIDVVLADDILTPSITGVENMREGEAKMIWETVSTPLFEDSFESYDDWARTFGNFTIVDNDGLSVFGAQDYEYPDENTATGFRIMNYTQTTPQWENLAGNTGNKIAASFAANDGNTPNGAVSDDWLITPQISVGANFEFSFFAKSVTDEYGLERFNVYVSTESTDLGDFTKISTGDYVEAPTTWTEFSYDISSYYGENIYIAIQCVSADAFVFMVDDLSCKPADGKLIDKLFEGYNVYLDDFATPVATGVQAQEYVFTGLVNGNSYTAGLKGVYSTGESSLVTYNFDYSQVYTVAFNVADQGEPVEGIKVEFNNETKYSDATGAVSFDLESANSVNYTISSDDYYEQSGNIDVTSDVTQNISLIFIPDVNFLVKDDNGVVLEGVKLTFASSEKYTDINGIAEFVNIPTADDMVYRATLSEYLAVTDTVDLGLNDTTYNVVMYELPEVNFIVKDADNIPVEGAKVYFDGYIVLTDVNGIALFENAQPDSKKPVRVKLEGYITYYDTLNLGIQNITSNVTLHEIPDVKFVVASQGTNVSGATIEFNEQSITTDNAGEALFEEVESGSYIYSVSMAGYYTVIDTLIVEISDVTEMVEISVIPDVTFNVEFNDAPMQGVKVTLNDTEKTTAANGQVTFVDVEAGDHTYQIELDGYYVINDICTVSTDDMTMNADLVEIPDVMLTITNGNENIPGAVVEFNGETIVSNTEGEVLFPNVPAGKYRLVVTKDTYFEYVDTIEVALININEIIVIEKVNYDVNFVISDGENLLADALVLFNGETKQTSSEGTVAFADVLLGDNYEYLVSKDGYASASGFIDVIDKDVTEEVAIELLTYTVTFTVTDNNGFVEDASVTFQDQTILTTGVGIAEFVEVIPSSNIAYTVSKEPTHHTFSGVLNVDGNEQVDVELGIVSANDNSAQVLSIYPNPTNGILTINLIDDVDFKTIEVTDEAGRIIQIIEKPGIENKVNLSGYEQGIYFVKAIFDNTTVIEKVILE